jgi:uncharacterized protein (TIGR03083 family)
MHPAPPTDLTGLVDAFERSAQAVIDLGQSCSPVDFELQTECPGWTVKDQISHIVGIESWLDGAAPPTVDLPDLPHLKNEVAHFVELFVQERRDLEGADVVGELEDVLVSRMSALRDSALTEASVLRGVFGPTNAVEALTMRVIDIWVHQQDIRAAIGRPGNLDCPSAAAFVNAIFTALPRIVARDAAVPVGHAVLLDITGPVMGRAGVRVVEGEDGRPKGEPLFTGDRHEGSGDKPEKPGGTTSITLSTDALTRRAAGRRSVDEIIFTVHGDEDVARRVLEHLVIIH